MAKKTERRTANEALLYHEIDELKKLNSNLTDVYKQSMAELASKRDIIEACHKSIDNALARAASLEAELATAQNRIRELEATHPHKK